MAMKKTRKHPRMTVKEKKGKKTRTKKSFPQTVFVATRRDDDDFADLYVNSSIDGVVKYRDDDEAPETGVAMAEYSLVRVFKARSKTVIEEM